RVHRVEADQPLEQLGGAPLEFGGLRHRASIWARGCQNPSVEQLFDTGDSAVRRGHTRVPEADRPLPVRLRPATVDELVGQQHLLGPDSPLRRALEQGEPHSMILYGPPGTGKTTIARLMAENASAAFEEISAVNAGRAEVREVLKRADHRLAASGEPTIFFLDEIHRF